MYVLDVYSVSSQMANTLKRVYILFCPCCVTCCNYDENVNAQHTLTWHPSWIMISSEIVERVKGKNTDRNEKLYVNRIPVWCNYRWVLIHVKNLIWKKWFMFQNVVYLGIDKTVIYKYCTKWNVILSLTIVSSCDHWSTYLPLLMYCFFIIEPRKERRNRFLRRFQPFWSYHDEIESLDFEEIPFSKYD